MRRSGFSRVDTRTTMQSFRDLKWPENLVRSVNIIGVHRQSHPSTQHPLQATTIRVNIDMKGQ